MAWSVPEGPIRVWPYQSAPANYREAAALPDDPEDETAFLAVISAEYAHPAYVPFRHFLFATARDCTCTLLPDGSAIYVGTMPEQPSIYERLGGEPGVKKIIAVASDHILADRVLRNRFRRVDLAAHQDGIAAFVCAALGGPQLYPGPDIRQATGYLRLSEDHLDLILEHLAETLRELDVPPLTAADTVVTLAPLKRLLAVMEIGE